jgi:hypothetical protein
MERGKNLNYKGCSFFLSLIITYSNGQSYNTPEQGTANIFFGNYRIAWIIII